MYKGNYNKCSQVEPYGFIAHHPKGMPQSVKRGRSKILIAMETFRSEEFKKAV